MLRALLPAALVLVAIPPLAGRAEPLEQLKSVKLQVPTSDVMFPPGKGADVVDNNCLACHSADHMLNQPALPKATWEEVVNKMITAYKAPITPEDAAVIVDYLTRTKGK
jgi:mono/diheme cytochrome c family protein